MMYKESDLAENVKLLLTDGESIKIFIDSLNRNLSDSEPVRFAKAWADLHEFNQFKNSLDSSFLKRAINDDSFTSPEEAISRSMDLGLEGRIHVNNSMGMAVYMPGQDQDEYLKAYSVPQTQTVDNTRDKQNFFMTAIKTIIESVIKGKKKPSKILKMDEEQRIVYGWASVSTEDNQPIIDGEGDYIPIDEMVKAANKFMLESRQGKQMHSGDKIGEVIHSLPLTNELAKSFGISTNKEGWIIGMKVFDDTVWNKIRSGGYNAFSIGGRAENREAINE